MTTIMQPFQCDLQPQIPKHLYKYARTSTPKAAWSHRYNAAKKKANRPQPHPPHTGGTFHRRLQPIYTEKYKVSCSGFLPKTKPVQHSCPHYNALHGITSQTCTYLRTWQHQMTTIMQPFQGDLQPQIPKHLYKYARTSTPKAAWSHHYNAAKKRQTDRSRTRRTQEVPFIAACSQFTRKNTKFRAPASSPKQSPVQHSCPHYNAVHGITSQTCTYLRTWQHQMTTIMQPFQCDLQPRIPKHLYKYPRTSTPKAAWSHRYNAAKKKANRPQPHPPHTGGTFHRRLQPLYIEKFKVSCSGFLPKTKHMQQPLHCVTQHHVANLHVSTHMAAPDDNNHAAIPMRSATTDSKTPL